MINSKRPPLSTTTYLIPPNSRRTKDELGPPSIASDATSIAPSEATQVDLRKEIKYGTALQVNIDMQKCHRLEKIILIISTIAVAFHSTGSIHEIMHFPNIIEITGQAAWGLFLEFSMNSTVHGIRYFGERKRHWTERCGLIME